MYSNSSIRLHILQAIKSQASNNGKSVEDWNYRFGIVIYISNRRKVGM